MYRRLTPSMINMQAQTITLPLNLYLELCKQCDGDDMMDEFLMYTYKVKRCPRKGAHNWTECPYAHQGEKARRRDPKKFPYQGVVCPEFKINGECKRGNNCEFAHGVFEFWLHPSRFRTQVCESGVLCQRKVCFFAHTPEQLRSEGVHHCSRCKRSADPSSAVVADATTDAEGSTDGGREKAAALETEATLAVVSSSSGGGDGTMIRVRDTLDEYNDFDHLGWVVDLVSF